MHHYRLALLGFGNVGRALARLLLRKRDELQKGYGITFSITGIATARHGLLFDADGLDMEQVLSAGLETLPAVRPGVGDPARVAEAFIRGCAADVLFENTPVNYATGQPAADHLRLALEMGMHAITANKGPVVHAYRQLTTLAQQVGRRFLFESAVMDGAPIFSLFRETLPAARLVSFRGVLNSTTNLILARMEAGESFADALAYAQSIGVAESDPSGDIDGWDAAVKVAALSTVLMDVPLLPAQVDRRGIREITPQHIAQAHSQSKRWKLVCAARRDGDGVQARVAPQMVGADSPLYGVSGTTSMVEFETDVLPRLSVVEGEGGPETTAYGLLADFIHAVRRWDDEEMR